MQIPQIEPFQFIRSTAFSERVQLANKINEIINGINLIGDIPVIQTQVDALSSKVSTIQAGLASTDADLEKLTEQVNSLISEVNDTIKTQITALQGKVSTLDSRMDTAESDISGLDSEVKGLLSEVIDSVAMSSTAHGTVQVQINHEDGSNDISQPIDLGLVEQGGIVLQSGTTDRSFKLIVTLTDGTSWQTNDFVIPEGGGTDVSVTSISIAQGTGTDKIEVKIGLSDGSTISSNDWTVVTPSEFSALGTRVTTAEGNITKNTGDISELNTRVQALEDSPGFTLQPATVTRLGGVKIGSGITVQADGTIAVDMTKINTAAVASTVKFTADTSKVTLHADSLAGSDFTKDIPQASQGGAGTIDAAAYQKLSNVPDPPTIATDAEISRLEADIAALAPSVSVNDDVNPPTITVGINGKTAQANLPGGGEQWEELSLSSLPTDFSSNDRIEMILKNIRPVTTFDDWNVAPSLLETPIVNTDTFFRVEITPRAEARHVLSTLAGICLNARFGPIALITVNPRTVTQWNGSASSYSFFAIEIQAFSGAGVDGKEISVSRSNITDYVVRMRRIKNYFA